MFQVAFIAGVADAKGFGWATAKQLASAGATVIVGTWPPMLKKFEEALKQGFGEDAKLQDGSSLNIQKVCHANIHNDKN
jgi:enoyl-[acyl-carrier protein] reductase I